MKYLPFWAWLGVFCMNSIPCHAELDNSLAMELKESGF